MKKNPRKKRAKALWILILSFVMAVTSFAEENDPDLYRTLSLKITLRSGDDAVKGTADIYQVAKMEKNADGNISFPCLLPYTSVQSRVDKDNCDRETAVRFSQVRTRETRVASGKTDALGDIKVSGDRLQPGMYLVVIKDAPGYAVDPFLVPVPQYVETEEGRTWQYDVICRPKSSRKKPRLPKPQQPKTGDTGNIPEYAGVMTGALAIILFIFYKKQKSGHDT